MEKKPAEVEKKKTLEKKKVEEQGTQPDQADLDPSSIRNLFGLPEKTEPAEQVTIISDSEGESVLESTGARSRSSGSGVTKDQQPNTQGRT